MLLPKAKCPITSSQEYPFPFFKYTYYKWIRISKVKTEVFRFFSTDRLKTNKAQSSVINSRTPWRWVLWCTRVQVHGVTVTCIVSGDSLRNSCWTWFLTLLAKVSLISMEFGLCCSQTSMFSDWELWLKKQNSWLSFCSYPNKNWVYGRKWLWVSCI